MGSEWSVGLKPTVGDTDYKMRGIIIIYCFMFLANLLTSANSQTTPSAVIILLKRQKETKPMASPITSEAKSPVSFTTSFPTIRTPRNRLKRFKAEETVRRGFFV